MIVTERRRRFDALSAPFFYCAAFFGVSLLFLFFPTIDLIISDFFYLSHGAFYLEGAAWVKYIRKTQYFFYAVIIIVSLIALCGGALFLKPYLRRDLSVKKFAGLVLFTLTLGPGVFVNLHSKEYWGRPRPHQIMRYGGEAPYVKVWTKAEYCASNCSFVGGESSGAAWFSVFAYLLRGKYYRKALLGAAAFFLIISYFRLGAGGHFLSDIVIGAIATLFLNALIVGFFYKNKAVS